MTVDFDPLDDLLGDESRNNDTVVKKFRPKPKQLQRKPPQQSSVASTQSVETQPIESGKPLEHISDVVPNEKTDLQAFDGKSVEENADVLIQSEALADCLPRTNKEIDVYPSEVVASNAPITETVGGNRATLIQEMDVMDSLNATGMQNETCGSISSLFGLQSSPIQPDSAETCLGEDVINLLEVPQLDSSIHMEGIPENRAKLASRRAKTANGKANDVSDSHFEREKASTSSEVNEDGRQLRPRIEKTNICGLVDEDEDEDEILGGEELFQEPTIDEEIENHEQPQEEYESGKKNSKRKSKKSVNDEEKPRRKSKKAKEASKNETHPEPKKKFSHSTRRRRVNQNLLNIPEEEFDPRLVSLRDLILLAEHREKEMKAGVAVAGAPEKHDSAGKSNGLHNDAANNYDAANTYGGESNDEEGSPIAEDTTEYFNYHSRMEKTARVKWSKNDTEQFYEAVRRFGTDFDMMEKLQIFPGRSRKQIRNKYKKEQREHPMMLGEASVTRSKDLSFHTKVKEDFKKMRAEREKADLEDFSDEEGEYEGGSNANDDKARNDHNEEEENADVASGSGEARSSPVKEEEAKAEEVVIEEEEEEDDDEMLWNQYKSDM